MSHFKNLNTPQRKLLIASMSVVISLAAYGRTESFYMSHGTGALKFTVYNVLFLLPTLLACVFLGGKRRRWVPFYALFLGFYGISLRYVNSKRAIELAIPVVESKVPIALYHILLFGLGFFFLVTALAVALNGRKLWKNLPALYGALLIGLVYQDWFWFLTHPRGNLTCGSLYGVYFTWWIKLGFLCIPGMYLVGILAGLSILLIFGERSREFVLSVLGLIAAMTLTGLALSFCLP